MKELFFVDTNILVYARDVRDSEKQTRAQKWMDFLWRSKRGCLSVQVLCEYYETVRKKQLCQDLELVQNDITSFFAWNPIQLSPNTLSKAFSLRKTIPLSWWDSLIVSSAIESSCAYFLSEDLQANQVIEGMRIINPFHLGPEAL